MTIIMHYDLVATRIHPENKGDRLLLSLIVQSLTFLHTNTQVICNAEYRSAEGKIIIIIIFVYANRRDIVVSDNWAEN